MNTPLTLRAQQLACVAALAVLTACGGGGSSSSDLTPGTSTAVFSVATAGNGLVADTSPLSYTLAGSANGVAVNGSGTIAQSALAPATFDGQTSQKKTTVVAGSMLVNNQVVNGTDTISSYYDVALRPTGLTRNGLYSTGAIKTGLPSTARVGDSGIFLVAQNYTDSTSATPLGRSDWSWRLVADSTTTAGLYITESRVDNAGATILTTESRFVINPAGTILRRAGETTAATNTRLELTYR